MKLSLFPNRNTVIKVPISKAEAMNRIINSDIDLNTYNFDKRIDGDTITLSPRPEFFRFGRHNSFIPMTTIHFTEGIWETEIHICSYLKKGVTIFMYIWLFLFILFMSIAKIYNGSFPLIPTLGMVAAIFIVFFLSYTFSAKRIKANIVNTLK